MAIRVLRSRKKLLQEQLSASGQASVALGGISSEWSSLCLCLSVGRLLNSYSFSLTESTCGRQLQHNGGGGGGGEIPRQRGRGKNSSVKGESLPSRNSPLIGKIYIKTRSLSLRHSSDPTYTPEIPDHSCLSWACTELSRPTTCRSVSETNVIIGFLFIVGSY